MPIDLESLAAIAASAEPAFKKQQRAINRHNNAERKLRAKTKEQITPLIEALQFLTLVPESRLKVEVKEAEQSSNGAVGRPFRTFLHIKIDGASFGKDNHIEILAREKITLRFPMGDNERNLQTEPDDPDLLMKVLKPILFLALDRKAFPPSIPRHFTGGPEVDKLIAGILTEHKEQATLKNSKKEAETIQCNKLWTEMRQTSAEIFKGLEAFRVLSDNCLTYKISNSTCSKDGTSDAREPCLNIETNIGGDWYLQKDSRTSSHESVEITCTKDMYRITDPLLKAQEIQTGKAGFGDAWGADYYCEIPTSDPDATKKVLAAVYQAARRAPGYKKGGTEMKMLPKITPALLKKHAAQLAKLNA